jgi:hypothetical protein
MIDPVFWENMTALLYNIPAINEMGKSIIKNEIIITTIAAALLLHRFLLTNHSTGCLLST